MTDRLNTPNFGTWIPPFTRKQPSAPKRIPGNFLRYDPDSPPGGYIGWKTSTGKKPSFGEGYNGPGEPYQEVAFNRAGEESAGTTRGTPKMDLKSAAIRRRLGNGNS